MAKIVLSQSRLDVEEKRRSNIFDWRGQFTPELIEYLISEFASPNCTIADPFSGSGTVLHEAVKFGCNACGFEINPSAYFMSKFYEYSLLPMERRDALINEFQEVLGSVIDRIDKTAKVYVKDSDYKRAYCNLLEFAKACNALIPTHLYPFVMNVIFLSEKDKKMFLYDSLIKNINKLKDQLYKLPFSSGWVTANWCDARNIGDMYPKGIDLVITSPPYINVFNYHQNYRGIMECFDYNILEVANSEIGSNRKNRQNRFITVAQYAIDMGHVLLSCSKALKLNGRMIWIVGRSSNVRKVPFYNSVIIEDIVDAIPGLHLDATFKRRFTNRYGKNIIEDIIIIDKLNDTILDNPYDVFRNIGIKHLQRAIPIADKMDVPDIESIVDRCYKIKESPIL